MGIYNYKTHCPQIDSSCFVAPSADIIGKVMIKENANIWYNTVIRGDVNQITIGENTNIQDLSMLHVADEYPLIIGNNVTVGHHVNLHGCTIEDSCLIGIGAIVLDGAVIGANSIVAAGTVVAPGKKYPPRSLIMGVPGKVVKQLELAEKFSNHYQRYVELARDYKEEGLPS